MAFALGAARQVSTPSDYSAWLGVAILQGSPNLSISTLKVSLQALQKSQLCYRYTILDHEIAK